MEHSEGEYPPTPVRDPGDLACVRCAASLSGIPASGQCPTCATPVAESLERELLTHASPRFVAKVRSGLSLILNGILLAILFGVVVVFVAYVSGYNAGRSARASQGEGPWMWIVLAVGTPIYLIIVAGYWRFTSREPASAFTERSETIRSVIRTSLIVQIVLQLASIVLDLALEPQPGEEPSTAFLLAGLAVGITNWAAFAAQFFGVMLYTRLLARRIPDQWLARRVGIYMWLLPVLSTVGILLIIGPLVALVLYWNLLDRLRRHMKSIESSGRPAQLAASLA